MYDKYIYTYIYTCLNTNIYVYMQYIYICTHRFFWVSAMSKRYFNH